MVQRFKRSFFRFNKFQQKLLVPILLICFIAMVMVFYCLFYFYQLYHTDEFFSHSWLVTFFPWVILALAGLQLLIIFLTVYITNKIVGPYGRVIRELDEIIAGTRSTPIGLRPGDEMFQEIVKRINTLMAKLK